MNQCPDCETPLAQSAKDCRCGWTLPVVRPSVQTREDRMQQEIAELTEQARAAMEAKGLNRRPGESLEEWRQRTTRYVKEQIMGIGRAA